MPPKREENACSRSERHAWCLGGQSSSTALGRATTLAGDSSSSKGEAGGYHLSNSKQDTWKSACPSSLPDPHSIRYIHCRTIYPSHSYNPSAFLHTLQEPHLHRYISHQPLRSGMRCLLLNLLLGAFAFLVPFPHRSCDATLGARMGLAARMSLPVKLALPASRALASSS